MITQKHIENTKFFTTNGTDIWKIRSVSKVTLVELVNCETGRAATIRLGEQSSIGLVPVRMPKVGSERRETRDERRGTGGEGRGTTDEGRGTKKKRGKYKTKAGEKKAIEADETKKPDVEFPSLRGEGDGRGCRAGKEASSKYVGVTVRKIKSGQEKYYAQSFRGGKYTGLGAHAFEEEAAAAVQEHLGNSEEATRLRLLVKQKTQDKIAETMGQTAFDCTKCGAGYETKPVKCSHCGGFSFAKARPEK